MFEGDLKVTLQTHALANFCSCGWGTSNPVKVVQMGSEDSHRLQGKLDTVSNLRICLVSPVFISSICLISKSPYMAITFGIN